MDLRVGGDRSGREGGVLGRNVGLGCNWCGERFLKL